MAASVDLVVHVGTDAAGQRRVREIVALPGRAEGGVVETADIFTTRDGRLVRADGYPPHPDRFAAPASTSPRCSGTGHDGVRGAPRTAPGRRAAARLAQRAAGAAARAPARAVRAAGSSCSPRPG